MFVELSSVFRDLVSEGFGISFLFFCGLVINSRLVIFYSKIFRVYILYIIDFYIELKELKVEN